MALSKRGSAEHEPKTRRHPLIIRTEVALKALDPDKYGMLRLWRHPGCLDVRASRSSLLRALKIMNRVMKRLEKAGHKVQVTSDEKPRTVAIIDGQRIEFGLWEWAKRVDHVPTKAELERLKKYTYSHIDKWDYKPSGRLALEIDRWRYSGFKTKFVDGERSRLEDHVDAFLESLGKASLDEMEREQERLRRQQEWEVAELRRIEEQRRLEEEEKRIQVLMNQASNWQKSRLIREFLDHVKTEATLAGIPYEEHTSLGEWIAWVAARGKAIDPIEGMLSRFQISAKKPDSIPEPAPDTPTQNEMPDGSDSEDKKGEGRRRLKSLDRTSLYEQVWSQPVQEVAKVYGISGRGLGKVCSKLQVPVPPRGYWARIRNGYRVRKPPLPKLAAFLTAGKQLE